jgi:hypothetical protein
MRVMPTLVVLACGGPAAAQTINIDFGNPGSTPSDSYAAAGRGGVWNPLGNMPASVRFPLMDRAGNAAAAQAYNLGGSALLDVNNPGTSGDDEGLMDDMFLSFNNPVDLCLFFENMTPGVSDVILYAMTPDNPALQSRVRFDFSTPGPTMVGGAWPGSHQPIVTYSIHRLTVGADGRLQPHSGLFNGFIQSGINGLQILSLAPCPGDANSDYDVDFSDLTSILGAFGDSGTPGLLPGDSNHDGAVNFADITATLGSFGGKC